MFLDLFSNFDFTTFSNFCFTSMSNLVWLSGISWIMLFFWSFKWNSNPITAIYLKFSSAHFSNKGALIYDSLKGVYTLTLFLFFFIVKTKFWGLVPYIFSKTSQILFVFCLAFFVWLSMVYSSLMKKLLRFLYFFFPKSPGFILPFLNIMEIVSFFIRPLTLTLRLSIKITTGHIFVSLLSKVVLFVLTNSMFFVGFTLVLLASGIFLFEGCMAVIQALVFSLLVKSYAEDHTHFWLNQKMKVLFMFSWMSNYDSACLSMKNIVYLHDLLLVVLLFTMVFVGLLTMLVFFNSQTNNSYVEAKFLELVWTIILIFFLMVIFVPSILVLNQASNNVFFFEDTMKITGHQWNWEYEYSLWNKKLKYISSPEDSLFNRLYEVSLSVVFNTNNNTLLKISSDDVIHSFSIPELGLKIDAVPGRVKELVLQNFKKSFGVYSGQCSEICGILHSNMPILAVCFPL